MYIRSIITSHIVNVDNIVTFYDKKIQAKICTLLVNTDDKQLHCYSVIMFSYHTYVRISLVSSVGYHLLCISS